MALRITPNPSAAGRLSLAANQNARMSSIVSMDWDNVTGKPTVISNLAASDIVIDGSDIQAEGFALDTGATIGNGNTLKMFPDTNNSSVIDMPANGWIWKANLSANGGFASAITFDIARVSYNLTATSGLFYNPSNLPIRSDNDRYLYVQNFALISDNQLALNDTFNSCTPTVTAQAVTAITVSPNLTGYSAAQTVGWTAYQSNSIYAQGTVQATAGGVINTTQFASATGLPTDDVFTSTPIILVQKPDTTNNNAVLDIGPQHKLSRITPTVYPAAGSYLGQILWEGTTGSGSTVGGTGSYASIFAEVVDPTTGTSSANLHFTIGNATTAYAKLTPAAWTPGSNDLIALGSASVSWSDLYLANGAVINFNNADCAISHGTNTLAFTGASGGYQFDNPIIGTASDTLSLGTASNMVADLFLASGGVINWNNGDVTATHSSNALAFAGASSGYSFDAVVLPASNDGAALGSTSNQFSDLFLAEGGVINFDNGDVTVTQSSNSLTVAGGNLIFPGTATNDDAAAGVVGEFVSSAVESGSAVSLTSGAAADVTSISLTAGDWDVTGIVHLSGNAATTFTNGFASISTTTATLSNTAANASQIWGNGNTIFASATYVSMPQISRRISVASTTTVYLVTTDVFGTNTCAAFGYIQARRVR